jgi:hypothetical protein
MEVDIYLKKVTETDFFAIFGLTGREGMGKTCAPIKIEEKV